MIAGLLVKWRGLLPWLLIALLGALALFSQRANGKLSQKLETSGRKNDAQNRVREAGARTSTLPDDVVRSLRDGTF